MTTKNTTETTKTTAAVWFSATPPTTEQLVDVRLLGHHIAEVQAGMIMGAQPINTFEYRDAMMVALRELVDMTGAQAIFGVAPTPILNAMHREVLGSHRTVPFYAAWNVQRSVEGGKPTFEHFIFEEVGAFKVE